MTQELEDVSSDKSEVSMLYSRLRRWPTATPYGVGFLLDEVV
jgi:hypothetical protein